MNFWGSTLDDIPQETLNQEFKDLGPISNADVR